MCHHWCITPLSQEISQQKECGFTLNFLFTVGKWGKEDVNDKHWPSSHGRTAKPMTEIHFLSIILPCVWLQGFCCDYRCPCSLLCPPGSHDKCKRSFNKFSRAFLAYGEEIFIDTNWKYKNRFYWQLPAEFHWCDGSVFLNISWQ